MISQKIRLENPLIASELYKELNYINSCYKELGADDKDLYDSINALNTLSFLFCLYNYYQYTR